MQPISADADIQPMHQHPALCRIRQQYRTVVPNVAIKMWPLSVFFLQVKAGCILNIIGIATINIGINTWGKAMFKLDKFPEWANVTAPWVEMDRKSVGDSLKANPPPPTNLIL